MPMTVLRRLDAVLEPTKQAVLDMKTSLDKAVITNQDQALRQAAGQAFLGFYTQLTRGKFSMLVAAGFKPPTFGL